MVVTGDDTGMLVLDGEDNTYGGGTVVEQGTLIAADTGAIPNSSALVIGAGGTFVFDPTAAGAPLSDSSQARPAGVETVPEPGTIVLLLAALVVGLGAWRRRS